MDPTRSFDHLDPKLKDTYARVMGTDTTNHTMPDTPTQFVPAADPSLSTPSSPNTMFTPQPAVDPNQFGAPQMGQTPSVGGIETTPDANVASATFSPSLSTPPPEQATAAPFFTNTSPAATDPMQQTGAPMTTPIEPTPVSPSPVTPFNPEDPNANQNPALAAAAVQPLPSPASVNQATPHEVSPLLRVLYIIGAVIFFAIYTIFWIKVFNLPFLF